MGVLEPEDVKTVALAEIESLSEADIARLESMALALCEGYCRRRLTLDEEKEEVTLDGSGLDILPLPERLDTITSVVTKTQGDVTDRVVLRANGWILKAVDFSYFVESVDEVTISGNWGITTPESVKYVLAEIVRRLAIREADKVTQRDQALPWGSVSDGAFSSSRDPQRRDTMENLLTFELRAVLDEYKRPDLVAVI